jgi:4'-phosphopantetheinyl transferase
MEQVDAWIQPLDVSPGDLTRLFSSLASDERERAARFHSGRHRDHYIVARGRLREILSYYLGRSPASIEFTYGPFGKPALLIPALHFNVSHSGVIAVYAVARSRSVGIDVEEIRPEFSRERIAERFFSSREVRELRSLPAEAQTDAFFRCWTRKEAYLKACGGGLSIPLDSFDVTLRPEEPAMFLRGGEGWSVRSFAVPAGYAGAIVAEGNDWELALR